MAEIIGDIRDSIQALDKLYRETEEMATVDLYTAMISTDNFENDCYEIMNEVMFSFRVAPEAISYNDGYCVFEYKGLFFWIGFIMEDNCKTHITIFFETDISDFKNSLPYANISDRCDGWAEDGLFSWMNSI